MGGGTVIIGGGVVGLACALALLRHGLPVTVIEPDRQRQAVSWGNAGHIAVEQVEPLASWATIRSAPGRLFSRGGALALPPGQARHWLPFAARMAAAAAPDRFARGKLALAALLAEAMPAWRALADSLPADNILREDGHLVTWGDPAAAARGRAAWAAADIGTAWICDLTTDEAASLTKMLGRAPADAIRFEGSGQVRDLGALAEALEAAIAEEGGQILSARATLQAAAGTAEVGLDDGRVLTPDRIVVAAGVRSGALLAPLGHRVPIVAERGYHIRATDHDWPTDMPPLVFEDRSMIVTRYAGCVQAASFVEFGHADAAPDPAKWRRLEWHVADLGLPMRGPFSRWMGARPTLPDYLPAIGRSRHATNLLYAFGHQHLGLTLAPVTAALVAALAVGEAPPVDMSAFDLDRFAPGRRFV